MWTVVSLDVAGTVGASARQRSAVGKNLTKFCVSVPRGSTHVPSMGNERNVRNVFEPFVKGFVAAVLVTAIFAILLLLASQFVGLSSQSVVTLSSSTEPK